MDLMEIGKLLADEKAAENVLREKGILPAFASCPKCSGVDIIAHGEFRLRCRTCGRTHSRRHGSILSGSKVACRQLLGMVKLFELERPALPSARQARLSKNTVSRFYMLMRRSLAEVPSPRLAGEVEADESCFGGKR